MVARESATKRTSYEVRAWEFNLLLVEVGLLGALAMGVLPSVGRRYLGEFLPLPSSVWMSLGVLLIGLALYPILSIELRNAHSRELRFRRWVVGWLIGAALGTPLYLLLR